VDLWVPRLGCAAYGYPVWLIDNQEKALERAAQSHVQELDRRIEKQQITTDEKKDILNRLHTTTKMPEGLANADLVIEVVPELLDLKREIFTEMDKLCPSHTILATNSSSIRISAIEDATRRPAQLLNMHFYPPIWQRSMVELMRGTLTSEETIETVRQFTQTVGLVPLRVCKESTGFIFNRVWRAIKKECLHLVDDGVASHEDVDRAWMIAVGTPIGPFGLMDMVGLDVVRDIEMAYYRESGDESDLPPKLLLNKIEKEELGIKTGKGFYNYPNPEFQNTSWLKGRND
jgi:3-hydroxybutyryl-CoA dehydrogenase